MCLMIEIMLPGIHRTKAGEITKLAQAAQVFPIQAIRNKEIENECRFFLSSDREMSCACELFADDAGEQKETWDLDATKLASIAKTIEFLSRQGSEKMYFQAFLVEGSYKRDIKKNAKKISLANFIDLIHSNSISSHTGYEISLGTR